MARAFMLVNTHVHLLVVLALIPGVARGIMTCPQEWV